MIKPPSVSRLRCHLLKHHNKAPCFDLGQPRCGLPQSVASTSRRRQRRAQPVADLAADAEDIKSRLANVPVYTVANKKNEFVLVSGEVCPSAVETDDTKLLHLAFSQA